MATFSGCFHLQYKICRKNKNQLHKTFSSEQNSKRKALLVLITPLPLNVTSNSKCTNASKSRNIASEEKQDSFLGRKIQQTCLHRLKALQKFSLFHIDITS